MILLIDNYDSFVFNLARYFERLGQATHVVRNDSVTPQQVQELKPDAVVVSPGPCAPQQAGCSLEVIRTLHTELPILGVCLGHQAIAEAFGGRVIRAAEPVHGRAFDVYHVGTKLFKNVASPFQANRYHSLIAERESLPRCLNATAHTADGTIMALEHVDYPVVGLQFHPESVLTDAGFSLLANFLAIAGAATSGAIPSISDERIEPRQVEYSPDLRVTF